MYTVAGTVFNSNRVAFGSSDAQATVDRYRAGTTIRVYYDPQNPFEAVLDPGVGALTYGLLLVGLVVILASIAVMVGLRLDLEALADG